jgi:3-isopropylmalate/(R)-2-methylmalate dehydratase small subunit
MEKFTKIEGVAAPLHILNCDTDMIIPAQWLKTIKRTGLGKGLFQKDRFKDDGSENPDFILNKPAYRKAQILVAEDNFGCGSSREHAPWALLDYGFQAVVSTEIADIFRNNSLKNGLLPIVVDETTHAWLMAHPGAEVEIDLERTALRLPDGREARFPVEAFARYCLMHGVDELGYLLARTDAIAAYERRMR